MSSFDAIYKEFKDKKPKNVYIFYGEENYLIKVLTEYALDNFIDEDKKSFYQKVFYGSNTDWIEVRNYCMTIPMGFDANPIQLVVVKEAQEIKKNIEFIINYINSPSSTTILIINFNGLKSLDKKIPNSAQFFESKKIEEKNMPLWIKNFLNSKGFEIDNDCSTMIRDFVGNNLENVSNQLEKLTIKLANQKKISQNDILLSLNISKIFNDYTFIDSLLSKNQKEAFKIANHYIKFQDFNLPTLIAILANNYLDFYKYKLAKFNKLDSQKIANEFNIQEKDLWKLKKYEMNIHKYSLVEIENIILKINFYDRVAKGVENIEFKKNQILIEICLFILNGV